MVSKEHALARQLARAKTIKSRLHASKRENGGKKEGGGREKTHPRADLLASAGVGGRESLKPRVESILSEGKSKCTDKRIRFATANTYQHDHTTTFGRKKEEGTDESGGG